jgi:hypothetical protein
MSEKHACVSCGNPGGDPRNGGLCPSCAPFTNPGRESRRSFSAMLAILSWGQR